MKEYALVLIRCCNFSIYYICQLFPDYLWIKTQDIESLGGRRVHQFLFQQKNGNFTRCVKQRGFTAENWGIGYRNIGRLREQKVDGEYIHFLRAAETNYHKLGGLK